MRLARKATLRNRQTKRGVKTALKSLQAVISANKDASTSQRRAQSALDTAVKKRVMHKNKAARKQSQLAKQAKAAAEKLKAAPAKKPRTTATKKTTKK